MKTILLAKKHNSEEWVLLAGPQVSHVEQLQMRSALNDGYPVNDKYSEVQMVTVNQETWIKSPIKFVTKKQHEENLADKEKGEKEFAELQAKEKARQEAVGNAAVDKEKKAHETRVEELNRQHEQFRDSLNPKKK